MKTANAHLMKEINKRLVRKNLLKKKAATKKKLTSLTNLSAMTVASIVEELVKSGEVYQGEMIPSNGGRPAVEYCYNGDFSHAAIIYGYQKNNSNHILLKVFNLFGKCVYKKKKYLSEVTIEHFDDLLKEAFNSIDNIAMIGFGLPGEEEEGTITINDYPALIGKNFMQYFQTQYQVPVIFENDANAATFGYYKSSQKLKNNDDTIVGLYFPRLYVPGMGLIIKGEIYRGQQNFAGEFSHLPLDINWEDLNYQNKEKLYAVFVKLLSVICCLLAPEKIVLYGDFFSSQDSSKLKKLTEQTLNNNFIVNIEVSTNFAVDYENGLKKIILDNLFNYLFGELNYNLINF